MPTLLIEHLSAILVVAAALGAIVILSVVYVYIRERRLNVWGVTLAAVGAVLIGSTVWHTVEFRRDSAGEYLFKIDTTFAFLSEYIMQNNTAFAQPDSAEGAQQVNEFPAGDLILNFAGGDDSASGSNLAEYLASTTALESTNGAVQMTDTKGALQLLLEVFPEETTLREMEQRLEEPTIEPRTNSGNLAYPGKSNRPTPALDEFLQKYPDTPFIKIPNLSRAITDFVCTREPREGDFYVQFSVDLDAVGLPVALENIVWPEIRECIVWFLPSEADDLILEISAKVSALDLLVRPDEDGLAFAGGLLPAAGPAPNDRFFVVRDPVLRALEDLQEFISELCGLYPDSC